MLPASERHASGLETQAEWPKPAGPRCLFAARKHKLESFGFCPFAHALGAGQKLKQRCGLFLHGNDGSDTHQDIDLERVNSGEALKASILMQ